MDETRIRVTTLETRSSHQMRPGLSELAEVAVAKAIEIPVHQLTERLSAEVGKLHEMFSNITLKGSRARITTATLTLGIDAEGEVSLCSVVTGSVTGQAAITLTFEFDADKS